MKVDFDASYKDIRRSLGHVGGHAPDAVEFSKLLSDLDPDNVQAPDSPAKNEPQASTPATRELDMRARLAIPEVALKVAPSERITPAIPVEQKAQESPPRVNTPTLLSARRVMESAFGAVDGESAAVRKLVAAAGAEQGVDPALTLAVVATESAFVPDAVSNDGFKSKGLMQLLDSTAQDLHRREGLEEKYKPFDAEQNVRLGVSYLRQLHEIFSNQTTLTNGLSTTAAANSATLEKLAVAAFNAGQGRVASAQERARDAGRDATQYEQVEEYLPKSTQEYVRRVLQNKRVFEAHFAQPTRS